VTYDSGGFSAPSFSVSSASGSLGGGVTAGAAPDSLYSYSVPAGGYDSNGNVLAYTDSVMGQWSFGYDQLNRVTTAANVAPPAPNSLNAPAPSWAPYLCWAYDNFGNRLAQSASNAAFTAGSGSCSTSGSLYQNVWATYNTQNQMTGTDAPGWTVAPPGYDAAGGVTNDGNHEYLYDAEGRLCAVEVWGSLFGYLYDAAGNRFLQQMLGHVSLRTTEKYTHVSIRTLQKVYAATHPGANLERKHSASQDVDRDAARAELLAALDAEVESDIEREDS